jgi:hypothetical protein
MRRRDFIKVIAGSAVAWPVAARAQQPGRVYRIGFITAGVPIRCECLPFTQSGHRNFLEQNFGAAIRLL